MPPLLFLFALGNLVVGSSAFLVSGLIGPIAADLGVGLPAAGQAMSVYALVTALAVPPLVALTARWPRRRALLLALALFLAGSVMCAAADSLGTLLAGRAVMGLGSMFTPLAAGIALVLVAPERRGQALSLVFLGMSLSYVVGVPLGAWIGLGWGWQAAVGTMAAAVALLWLAVAAGVPGALQAPAPGMRGLGAVLKRRDVSLVLLTTLLYFVAIFTVFSYIGPVLGALVALGGTGLSVTLALFGLSGVAGTLLGGWATDRFGAWRAMTVLLPTMGTAMLLLPLTEGRYPAMLAVLLVWGAAGFGMMAPQQSRLAQASPAQAPLLLSLNTSMLYLGTAFGAVVGGLAAGPLGVGRLSWAAAPFVALGLVLLWLGRPASGAPAAAGDRG
ncbi:MAG: MFS transporter [Rubrivivax sp.]|nr:MFS transporter [Rubrivivax sp.]